MKKQREAFPMEIIMLTMIMLMVMYIYCYSYGLKVFWLFFIIERVITFLYKAQMEKYLDDMNLEQSKIWEVIVTIVCCLVNVLLFVYIFFTYIELFLILVFGEILDFIFTKLFKGARNSK